jgi:hypothetical protein
MPCCRSYPSVFNPLLKHCLATALAVSLSRFDAEPVNTSHALAPTRANLLGCVMCTDAACCSGGVCDRSHQARVDGDWDPDSRWRCARSGEESDVSSHGARLDREDCGDRLAHRCVSLLPIRSAPRSRVAVCLLPSSLAGCVWDCRSRLRLAVSQLHFCPHARLWSCANSHYWRGAAAASCQCAVRLVAVIAYLGDSGGSGVLVIVTVLALSAGGREQRIFSVKWCVMTALTDMRLILPFFCTCAQLAQ